MTLTQIDPRTIMSSSPVRPDPALRKSRDLEALRQSTREFEAIYLNEMFKTMRKSISHSDLIPRSSAQDWYQEMMDMELAREVSQKGSGIGLAESMYRQLEHLVVNRLDR